MSRTVRGLLAAALCSLVLAGCSSGSGGAVGNGFSVGDGGVTRFSQGHRPAIEDVSGTTLSGAHLDLATMRGEVVVVNFWGSWCGPCRGEAQSFEQIAHDDDGHGVQVVGVNVRDNQASARAYEQTYHVTYPSLFDPQGLLALRFTHAVPASTPTTIVLDRQGRVAAKVSGALLYTSLRQLVDGVRSEPA